MASVFDIPSMKTVSFPIERIGFLSRALLASPALARSEVHVVENTTLELGRSLLARLEAFLVRGEETTETRTVTRSVSFSEFATWYDHLKYTVQERLSEYNLDRFIPWWLWLLLVPSFNVVTKDVSIRAPYKVMRLCPHFDKPSGDHLRFLQGTLALEGKNG